jgi:hypothetical protein
MMWLELITVYLAIGAPFAVSQGMNLRGEGKAETITVLLQSLRAALLWPLAAWPWLRQKLARPASATGYSNRHTGPEAKEQRAALAELTLLVRALPSCVSVAETERLWQQCRDAMEKYTGLTSSVYQLDKDASLSARAYELFRLEGRAGEDLLRAGRCLQRRNAARLKAHQIHARQEFLRVLEEINRRLDDAPFDTSVEELWQGFIGRARQLCLALQDEETAQEVTRRLAGASAHRLRPAVPAPKSIPPPLTKAA